MGKSFRITEEVLLIIYLNKQSNRIVFKENFRRKKSRQRNLAVKIKLMKTDADFKSTL